jgi:dephospho-CoA kinase
MRIIGLTGGIGAGKSSVLNILHNKYSAKIVEADAVAHNLQLPGQSVYNDIVEEFGEGVLSHDGRIDRIKLGKLVMEDAAKLEKLELMIHPAVKQFILSDIERSIADTEIYVIEAALLIQGGYKKICDEMWYVRAEKDVRIKRLISSRGYTEDRALRVIKNQPDDDFYIKNSDIIIDNSGDLTALEKEVETALNMG